MKDIGELKSKTSRDIYGFTVSVLKEVAHSLAEPTSALVQIIEFIMDVLHDSEEVVLTQMDLIKAFDSINHEKLLTKLMLFRSHLLGHHQIVEVNETRCL